MTTDAHTEPQLLRLLTVEQVARIVSTSTSTVRRWIREGQLPAVQLGGPGHSIRVAEEELRDWLFQDRGDGGNG
jgi:excisionase family DNA binding protein